MLAKTHRLSTKEFDAVFGNNSSFHSDNFILLRYQGTDITNKFAVVASKKHYSRRVDRNRLRRFIYRFLQNHPSLWADSPAAIIIAKKGALESIKVSAKKLDDELTTLLQK